MCLPVSLDDQYRSALLISRRGVIMTFIFTGLLTQRVLLPGRRTLEMQMSMSRIHRRRMKTLSSWYMLPHRVLRAEPAITPCSAISNDPHMRIVDRRHLVLPQVEVEAVSHGLAMNALRLLEDRRNGRRLPRSEITKRQRSWGPQSGR